MSYTNTLVISNQMDAIVNVVKQCIGDKLAAYNSANSGTVPAVIRKRTTDKTSTNQPAVNLPYPYAAVDFVEAQLWGGGEVLNIKRADNGNMLYETDYIVKFAIDFVGRSTDDPHSIALRMHRSLTTSYFRGLIADLTGGRLFKISNEVKRGVIQRQTEWVDMSTILLDISFRDVLEITSEGSISQIILNGELHNQFIDPNPILITIDTNGA